MLRLSRFDVLVILATLVVAGLAGDKLLSQKYIANEQRVGAKVESDDTPSRAPALGVAALSSNQAPTPRPSSKVSSVKCSPDHEQFYVLTPEQWIEMHTGGPKMKLTSKQTSGLCLVSGSPLILVDRDPGGPEPYIFRGLSVVDTVEATGDVVLSVINRVLEPSLKFTPLCLDICDEIVDVLPHSLSGQKLYVVADVRRTDEEVVRWTNYPELGTWTRVAPRDVDAWLNSMSPAFKGATVVAMTDLPLRLNDRFIPMMRKIKAAGPQKLLWLYAGEHVLQGHPLEPPIPEGVIVTRAATLAPLLKAKATLLFARGPDMEKVSGIPGSVGVTVRFDFRGIDYIRYHSVTGAWNEPGSYDMRQIPNDRQGTYVVYGISREDWRPWYLLQFLRSQGYQHLYLIQGGKYEYETAKGLKLIQ